MSVNTVPSISYYSLDVIQDEARRLVQKGVVSRQQPIYTLCQYIPAREWVCIECELENVTSCYAIASAILLVGKNGKTTNQEKINRKR